MRGRGGRGHEGAIKTIRLGGVEGVLGERRVRGEEKESAGEGCTFEEGAVYSRGGGGGAGKGGRREEGGGVGERSGEEGSEG